MALVIYIQPGGKSEQLTVDGEASRTVIGLLAVFICGQYVGIYI